MDGFIRKISEEDIKTYLLSLVRYEDCNDLNLLVLDDLCSNEVLFCEVIAEGKENTTLIFTDEVIYINGVQYPDISLVWESYLYQLYGSSYEDFLYAFTLKKIKTEIEYTNCLPNSRLAQVIWHKWQRFHKIRMITLKNKSLNLWQHISPKKEAVRKKEATNEYYE